MYNIYIHIHTYIYIHIYIYIYIYRERERANKSEVIKQLVRNLYVNRNKCEAKTYTRFIKS